MERDGFGMTRSLPLSGQPESHRGCRVFPKLFRRLREPSQVTALPGHTWAACGDVLGMWRIQPGPTLSGDTRSTKSPWLGRGSGQLLPCGQSAVGLV